MEHEEVVLIPRGIPGVKKATFKYALGADFINVLKVLHAVGLDSTKPVTVKGMQVAPRDLVMAVTPDPAKVGERMKGRAIVGTWAIGRKDGAPREVYLYQKTVGEESWANFGLQAVGWQTGFNPVLGLELLARGEWGGAGVYVPSSSIPTRTWPPWTAGASTGPSRSASRGRASRPDPASRRSAARRETGMERFIDVPGGRLFVVDEGDGPPVVLLHAGIVDLRAWDAFVPHLVAGGYPGRPLRRPRLGPLHDRRRRVLEPGRPRRGPRRAGDRPGGARRQQPGRPDRLRHGDRVPGPRRRRRRRRGRPRRLRGPPDPGGDRPVRGEERLEEAEPKDAEAIIALDTRGSGSTGPGQPAGRAAAWIADQVRETGLLLAEPGHVFGRPIPLDPPAAERLADLRCPVLAVAGLLDVSDVAETARHLEANAPNARAEILPDVAHMIAMERPAELAALVVELPGPAPSLGLTSDRA